MSRDRRGDGVQVVAGSNPACPTKSNLAATILTPRIGRSESNVVSSSRRFKRFGSPFLNDLRRF